MLKVKRTVDELFPLPHIKARIPVYCEHWLQARDYVMNLVKELDIPWDVSDYQPLPDWKPCQAPAGSSARHDLWAINYRLPFHQFHHTVENPWLNEIGLHHPYAYNLMVHTLAAKRAGIKEGDHVWVETATGLRVRARAKLSECIHPEVVAVAGNFGHWSRGRAIAKGQGVHFNSLMALDMERIDMISGGMDSCVKVRIYKARS